MKKHVFYVECQLFKIGFDLKNLLILFIKNTNRMKKYYTFFLISFAIFLFGQLNNNGHIPTTQLPYNPSGYTNSTMRQGSSVNNANNPNISSGENAIVYVNFTYDTTGKSVYLVYTTNGTNPSKTNGTVVNCTFSNYLNPDRTFVGTIPSTANTAGTTVKYLFYISNSSLANAWGRIASNTNNWGYQTSWTEGDNAYSYMIPSASSISLGSISGSPFCAGSTISVPYTATGTFNSGNQFTAQLSDASGSFASPISIASVTSTTSGTISLSIPSNAVYGTAYKVRVVSSNPSVTSNESTAFTIHPIQFFANLETLNQTICSGNNITNGNVTGRLYIPGITNSGGQGSGVTVQFGYANTNDFAANTHPSNWPNWTTATYKDDGGTSNNDDRYTINGFGSALSAGTYYYTFRYKVGSCDWVYGGFNSGGGGTWNGSTNVSGTLTVNAIPTAPTASATQVFCGSATVANLTATGTSIQWYSASTGGTPLSSSTALVNGNQYYASQTVSGCESPRTEVTVTINALPSVPSATGTTICSGSTATISATSGAGETIDWYASATGGTALLSGSTSYTSPSLTTTTTYYAEARNTTTGCKSATRTAVMVTVRSIGYATTHTPTSTTTCSPDAITVRGEVYAKFITDTPNSQGAPMVAEFGYGTSTDPNTWANWSTATYIGNGIENSNNDLYEGSISGITTNTYYYGFRFRISSGCTYYYAGIGGSYPSKSMRSIVINSPPTTSNAGSNQTVCGAATLAANTPTVGTGTWSVNKGTTAQFSNVNSPTATFTPNAGAGDYILTWTIASAGCTSSSSKVTITYNVPSATLSTSNSTQTIVLGNAIEDINYTLSNVTSASATGLPPGVTGNLSGSNFTISGTPTTMGIFNYNVMFNTSCGTTITANGSIRVNSNLVTFANIQLPKKDETIPKGSSISVYAHIIAPGTYGTGQSTSPAITAWIGYTTNATDATNGNFTSGSWVWVPAPYNTGYDSSPSYQITKDEYWVSDFGQTTGYQFSENAGDYYFVSRFQIASETGYIYGGSDGSTANISGGIWNGSNFVARKITVQECATNTWNGSSWSQGTPTIYHKAVIAENYSGNSFEACECEVNSNKTLTIGDGKYVKLKFGLVVNTGGNVIVENDANLIQEADYANNTGNITVKREALMKRLDYTYWGSPVTGQNLKSFSPGTLDNRFFVYREIDDYFDGVFAFSKSGDYDGSVMVDAFPLQDKNTYNFEVTRGYAIRAPNNFTTSNAIFNGKFVGVPNNGIKNFVLKCTNDTHGVNFIANPYPSNIDFDKLYADNSTNIYHTASFWTNVYPNTVMQGTNYPSQYLGVDYYNNYAIYNGSGGVGPTSTAPDNLIPNNIIKVGQGFMIKAKPAGANQNLVIKNSIRTNDNNGRFYNAKIANTNEVDRYWLRLSSPLGVNNDILVAYKKGATNDYEIDYDAKMMANPPDAFYSMLNDDKLAIQGRAYPLNINDVVTLGARFYQSGNYKISILQKEGIFANTQEIYIKDKLEGKVVNLQEQDYTFNVSTEGNITDRFEIVYRPEFTMGTDQVIKRDVVVYYDHDYFSVEAVDKITEILMYDTTGKLITRVLPNASKAKINTVQLPKGVYLLNIKMTDKLLTKKVIK